MSRSFDVPDTIPMSKVRAFLADLGIPAADTRELHVGLHGVYVEMLARDETGKFYAQGDDIAMHRISIRLDVDA